MADVAKLPMPPWGLIVIFPGGMFVQGARVVVAAAGRLWIEKKEAAGDTGCVFTITRAIFANR